LSTIASERENPAGPIGKIEKYPLPRPVDNDWLYDIDALRQKIDEIETTVDSFFPGKPKKLRHAIDNIQNVVDAMNRSGTNVEVSPSYFIISSLNSLKKILGGRYSGPDTPISPAELGAYYALMHHLVEYPAAFRDISLDFNSINMPDQPAVNAPGGVTGMLPTFMEFVLNRAGIGEQGVRVNSSLPGLEGRMLVSEAGLDDLTQVGVSINPKLRRAKKAVMMALPSIPYNQGRNPEFFVPGIGPISLTLEEIPNGFVDSIINELLEMATNKKPLPTTIMDTTITTAVAQLSQEIANNYEEAMNLAKEKPALRNQIVSNATNKAIEGFDEILKVSTFLVGVHEFGHLLDQVGDWRNSTNASNKNYGKGLNSAREFRLAVAELSAIESGMSSPFMEDISDMYATKFVVDQVMDALHTKMAHDAMLRDVPKMIEQREELDAKIKTFNESISSSMSGIGELDIRNSMDNVLPPGSGLDSIINSILSSILKPSQDESLEVLQSMRATLSMMDRQLAQAEEMMEKFQTKLQNMVPILKWLNKQTFGFDRMHYLLTDILTGNKNAIDEFMQNFAGTIYGKRDWFDENGKFDKAKYVASVIDKVNDDGLYQQLLMYVNELMIKQNNNGWKNFSDEEIASISALLPYISIYAGPAHYPGTKPAKNYAASNAEGYAELHVAKLLESADSLAQFSEQEKDLLDRLHSEMIEWATGSNKGM
jgi:tetrahydromethanopterin S-methyltransferase subunit B